MPVPDAATIIEQLKDAHQRSMTLIEGLQGDQLIGPKLAVVNPLRWEIGHAAYFYEFWILREHLKRAPIRGIQTRIAAFRRKYCY